MHTIIDARMILPYQTGVGRYLTGLAQGLSELSTGDQFEFWIQQDLPPNHPIRTFAGGNLNLREIPYRHMDVRSFWRIPIEITHRKPDLLHYPHFDLPWSVPGRIVATLHDLKYIVQAARFPRNHKLKRLVIYSMMYFTAHRSKRIIAVSKRTGEDIQNYLNISPDKISVIHLGIDVRFFQPASPYDVSHLSKHYGLEKPYLLFVGERRPHKNLPTLIKAFSIFMKSAAQSYLLVIAGRSYAYYQEPEKLVEALGLEDSVRFLDYVPDNDLPLLYRGASAFISLSEYEGFGLPALEAMASQTPVVVSNNTSFPEVVGTAGITIAPNDVEQAALALQKVIPGGEKREECILRGVQRAQNFTWQQCAEKTLSVYHQAVS